MMSRRERISQRLLVGVKPSEVRFHLSYRNMTKIESMFRIRQDRPLREIISARLSVTRVL